MPQDHVLASVTPNGREGLYCDECDDLADPFTSEFPRVAPFLLGTGRHHVSGLLVLVRDRVRRIHTDGFVIAGGAEGLPIGNPMMLGALKLEHTGHCRIANAMRVTWAQPAGGTLPFGDERQPSYLTQL